MRILFGVHQFFPEFHSGTERVVLNLARMAQRAGHYVHVLTCAVDPRNHEGVMTTVSDSGWLHTSFDGLPVTLLPRSSLAVTADIGFDFDDTSVRILQEWLAGLHFDVAHVLHTMRMGVAVRALQLNEVPYVLTLTDFFLPCARINMIDATGRECDGPKGGQQCGKSCEVVPWIDGAYLSRFEQSTAILTGASARVVPSDYVAKKFVAAYPTLDFQVLPHGTDLSCIADASSKNAGKSTHNELRLAFVGSLVVQKGLHVLLKALVSLPEARLTLKVVGGFYGDDVYRRQIESMLVSDSRFEFLGPLDSKQVADVLVEADLLCLPSQVPETFSLVLHEAAAAGTPSLVSDLGAPAAFLRSRECGGIVEAANTRAWATAIADIIATPTKLEEWRERLFLPLRIEEEAFFYESIYRSVMIDIASCS